MPMEHQRVRSILVYDLHQICEKLEIGGPGNSFDYDLERLLNYVRAQTKEECKHYDREEINLVEDGNTPPVVRCKQCGKILKELGF